MAHPVAHSLAPSIACSLFSSSGGQDAALRGDANYNDYGRAVDAMLEYAEDHGLRGLAGAMKDVRAHIMLIAPLP